MVTCEGGKRKIALLGLLGRCSNKSAFNPALQHQGNRMNNVVPDGSDWIFSNLSMQCGNERPLLDLNKIEG